MQKQRENISKVLRPCYFASIKLSFAKIVGELAIRSYLARVSNKTLPLARSFRRSTSGQSPKHRCHTLLVFEQRYEVLGVYRALRLPTVPKLGY